MNKDSMVLVKEGTSRSTKHNGEPRKQTHMNTVN